MVSTTIQSIRSRQMTFPVLFVITITLLRAVFVKLMGMMPQDAYYFFYSEHLALSYFDHPPMIAYFLRLFTEIFGQKVFVLKLTDFVLTCLSIWAFYYLSGFFLGGNKIRKALLLYLSTFMITILSLNSTPDVPLVLFWTLSLIALFRAIFREERLFWILAGVLMGLTFDSKYTGFLLPVGLVLFLLFSKDYRKYLLSKWFYISLFFFCLTIFPVVWWNIQNSNTSFEYQAASRLSSILKLDFKIQYFAGTIAHQSAIIIPILFFAFVYLIYRYIKKARKKGFSFVNDKIRFLLCFFLPLFAGFVFISFFYWVKLNWIMPAYITAVIWAGIYLKEKWIRYQLITSLVIHIALAIEIIFYPIPLKTDDTWWGWEELTEQVETIYEQDPEVFIFSDDGYKTTAVLNFYLEDEVYGRNIIGKPALQYDIVHTNLKDLAGKDAIFIDSRTFFKDGLKENRNPESLRDYFQEVSELDPILLKKKEKIFRKFLVYKCTSYQP